MSTATVTPIFSCKCGAAALPVDVELDGVMVGTGRACNACLENAKRTLGRMRPIFDAMISVGVDNKLANDTMTFLLDRLPASAGAGK